MCANRLALCALLAFGGVTARADIFRWDNGQLIPGTEGITPAPGMRLEGASLGFADLRGADLVGGYFASTNFHDAHLGGADLRGANLRSTSLQNANFSGADLTGSELVYANLQGAVLEGAQILRANFQSASGGGGGPTNEQIYSTASYRAKNLSGVTFQYNDLRDWDFSGQDLTGADFLRAKLGGAILDNAIVTRTNFHDGLGEGISKEQLYSTANYRARDLSGIRLGNNDLRGWDFSGQNLTDARFDIASLVGTDFSDSIVRGARFIGNTAAAFSKEQLYSTASYKERDLQRIWFENSYHRDWNFNGQNLSGAIFSSSTLTNARFIGASLTNAVIDRTTLTDALFTGADLRNVQGFPLSFPDTRNAILQYGEVRGLRLVDGQQFIVRDYDGDPVRGLGPMSIIVGNSVPLTSGSSVKMMLEADPWDSTIRFEQGMPVSLAGTLDLQFIGGVDVTAQLGRTFKLFDWTGVTPTGSFTVSSSLPWDLSHLYTTGDVTLALTGDTNGDLAVDLQDLNNVRNNFGGAGLGDTNSDGIVDLVDLNNVRNSFGASVGQAVPEPSTWTCAIVIAVATMGRGRWRR